MDSLWGEEFTIKETKKANKKALSKISSPKTPKVTTEKKLSSKSIKPEDKLPVIENEVKRILGKYAKHTLVIKDYDSFVEYIDRCIQNGIVAVDTETNNSLDPLTCKLMGLCLYTPGESNAYIPVNHVYTENGEKHKFTWQVTEEQINYQLSRLADTKIIMHNGKFDYSVIKCTCGIALSIYWDTILAARLLNENEKAGLKEQYRKYINPSQAKYDIEHLFQSIPYEIVPPEIFALYAATDSFMTYKLYEWQKEQFSLPANKGLDNIFFNVEMKVLIPTAEMELNGVAVDLDYCERLSKKYHDKFDTLQKQIEEELHKYDEKVAAWRLSEEANIYPIIEGKVKKSKNEQLENPIKLSSNTQLQILLYDILGIEPVYKKRSKSDETKSVTVDEEALNQIYEKTKLPLLKLILEQRGLTKLLNTYIDKIPKCVSPKDGRLHANYNQIGADTGRYSSSDPNMQNIPSHQKDLRMMFCASLDKFETPVMNNIATFNRCNEIQMLTGEWKVVSNISVGEKIASGEIISNVICDKDKVYITLSD